VFTCVIGGFVASPCNTLIAHYFKKVISVDKLIMFHCKSSKFIDSGGKLSTSKYNI
jgi:hypothetical protein